MLIRGVRALLGERLQPSGPLDVSVEGGAFSRIGDLGGEGLDGRGLLAVPGLINCHTHVGDSIAKDVAAGMDTDSATHPALGVKARVLSETPPGSLAEHMRASALAMARCGATCFVDFREGGAAGARLLRRSGAPVRAVVLGRTAGHSQPELDEVLGASDGIGISGANECGDGALAMYSRSPKLRAIHAAETEASVRRSVERPASRGGAGAVHEAPLSGPHDPRHPRPAFGAARSVRGIVACPRANAALGAGSPDIGAMMRSGCNVALGTDNVMVNSPDMLREMDYAAKSSGLGARRILQAATVNAGRILGDARAS